jgi:hypothetical protein
MKVEIEMYINEEDGATVLQKVSEIANRAKELGFVVAEAEVESTAMEEEEEEEEEEEDEEEEAGEEEEEES